MFLSMIFSTRHVFKSGLIGFAKLRKSVMILFNRLDSSTIISGIVLAGSNWAIFFFSNSAELLMIPRGFRISWEMPAVISPREDMCLAWPRASSSSIFSRVRCRLIVLPFFTTKRSAIKRMPITKMMVRKTNIWNRNMVLYSFEISWTISTTPSTGPDMRDKGFSARNGAKVNTFISFGIPSSISQKLPL